MYNLYWYIILPMDGFNPSTWFKRQTWMQAEVDVQNRTDTDVGRWWTDMDAGGY